MPFSVRDQGGNVLLARGSTITDGKQLELLSARQLFIDLTESEAVNKVLGGQLDRMLRADVSLGRMADVSPDYAAITAAPTRPVAVDRPLDWPNLQMRLRLLLVDPRGPDWIARLRALRDDAVTLLERSPDRALVRLTYDASTEFQDYSASHSLYVCMLNSLACTQLRVWDPAWYDSLTFASLTMNISFTSTQNELARQSGPLSDTQKAALALHPEQSAALLAEIGVEDPMWLYAVRHHHSAPPGPHANLAPEELIARMVRRTDRYTARLSPRKSRTAMAATAAAQVVLLDEGGQGDESGQALIRTLGLYPPGAWVKLACGEIALVVRRTPSFKAPVVVSLVNRSGMPLSVPALRNTKLEAYEVVGAVAPSQVKVRPNMDQMDKMA